MRITALVSIKGGGSKSTICQVMGTGLRVVAQTLGTLKEDQLPRPLIVDYDVQGSVSLFNQAYDPDNPTMYHVQKNAATMEEAVVKTDLVHIVTANNSLNNVDYPGVKYLEGVRALHKPLRESNLPYTHLIIDTPGNAVAIHLAQALTVADDVIIPIIPDAANFEVLDQTIDIVKTVKENQNPNLKIAGLLISRATRTSLTNAYTDAIHQVSEFTNQAGLPCKVFAAIIREKNDIRNSQDLKTSIFDTVMDSIQTHEYIAFLAEYLGIFNREQAKEYLEYVARSAK